MGRSVSYPCDSTVCFRDVSEFDEDGFDWDWFVDDVKSQCKNKWSSLYDQDGWIGREDRILLENDHVHIGVSEYCGLASIWMTVRGDAEHPELADNWMRKVATGFEEMFGDLVRIGSFSNGNSVYRRKELACS